MTINALMGEQEKRRLLLQSPFPLFFLMAASFDRFRPDAGCIMLLEVKIMQLTEKQIQKAIKGHRRRLKELRHIYTDDHPMVSWHLKQISHLEEMLRPHGVG